MDDQTVSEKCVLGPRTRMRLPIRENARKPCPLEKRSQIGSIQIGGNVFTGRQGAARPFLLRLSPLDLSCIGTLVAPERVRTDCESCRRLRNDNAFQTVA